MDEQETLNETMARASADWTDEDIRIIIAGLQEQAKLWNQEQLKGSRKLVKSKNLTGAKNKASRLAGKAINLKNLKL